MKTGTLPVWRQTTQGDLFTLADKIIHLNQILMVIAINTEKTVRMLKDDKVAITRNRIAAIDDLARGCGCDSRAFLQIYFYTFVNFLALLAELVQDLAFSWPDKDPLGRFACGNRFFCGGCRFAWRCFNRRRFRLSLGCCGRLAGRTRR